jgi:hypothetical protein
MRPIRTPVIGRDFKKKAKKYAAKGMTAMMAKAKVLRCV